MKKIMIDIDDVISDYSGYLNLVNEFLDTNYKISDVKGYYIQDLVPEDKKEDFIRFFVTKNIYDYSSIFPNCIETIQKLNEKYDVYICSAYVFRDNLEYSADSLKYKFQFLTKYLSFLDPHNYMFLSKKEILNCDIKIDDKIENLKNAETKLLFNAYHNQNISDDELKENNVIRVHNWLEIEKLLLSNFNN